MLDRAGLDKKKYSKDYVKYLLANCNNVRQVALNLFTDYSSLYLVRFLAQYKKCRENIKLQFTFSESGTTIQCTLYKLKGEVLGCEPFYIGDMLGYTDTFIVVNSFVKFRSEQCTVDFLPPNYVMRILCERLRGIPFVAQVGYLLCGDYDKASDSSDFSALDKLSGVYRRCGFVDVNDFVGNYEDSIIFLRFNDCSEAKVVELENLAVEKSRGCK